MLYLSLNRENSVRNKILLTQILELFRSEHIYAYNYIWVTAVFAAANSMIYEGTKVPF